MFIKIFQKIAFFIYLLFLISILNCSSKIAGKRIHIANDRLIEAQKFQAEKYAKENFNCAIELLRSAKRSYLKKNYSISISLADDSIKKSDLAIEESLYKILQTSKDNSQELLRLFLINDLLNSDASLKLYINNLLNSAEIEEKNNNIKEAIKNYYILNTRLKDILEFNLKKVDKWISYARNGIAEVEKMQINKYLPEQYENARKTLKEAEDAIKKEGDLVKGLQKSQEVSKICFSMQEEFSEKKAKFAVDKLEELFNKATQLPSAKSDSNFLSDYADKLRGLRISFLEKKYPEVIIQGKQLEIDLEELLKTSSIEPQQ